MLAAEGILTARGGLVSHAAVVARGWGKPAVVGAEALRIGPTGSSVGDMTVSEGDWLSIDGTNGTVVVGKVDLISAEPPPEFDTILEWADEIRTGHLGRPCQRRQRRGRHQRPAPRCRGDRAVPDRAHVLGRGPPAGRAADDPRR